MIEDPVVRDRIALLRFVMIFGVVILHTPEYVPITQVGDSVFDLIKAFFQNALFRTTVPVLTFLSGYLLFHSGLDQQPRKLLTKKSASLVVPFLCFNLPLLGVAFVAELAFGVKLSIDLRTTNLLTWLDAAFGLTHSPINYPLNFLRDIIVLVALAPLFGLLIRRAPYVGLVLVGSVFMTNLDGPLILRETMPVLFYMGGLTAVRQWDLRKLDRFATMAAAAMLLLCSVIVYFRISNTNYLRLVSPVMIWPAAAWLLRTQFGAWCVRMHRYSFLMFVAHAPLLLGFWMVYKALGQPVPYPVFWILSPMLVMLCVVGLHRLGYRLAPQAFPRMLGGRNIGSSMQKSPSRLAPFHPVDPAHDSSSKELVY